MKMRLNGEISHKEEEDDEEKTGSANSLPQKLVVGYALTSKKKSSFLQPKFESLARYVFYRLVFMQISVLHFCARFNSVLLTVMLL